MNTKKFSYTEAEEKIRHYCAYQERSHLEVRTKLFSYQLSRDQVDELITSLITTGFLNEERFAKSFAGGKFRIKKWGRLKIVNALESKGVSKNCIKAAMKEIESDDYENTLRAIILDKSAQLTEGNIFARRDKLSRYAIAKGYEPDLVWNILKEIFPDQR